MDRLRRRFIGRFSFTCRTSSRGIPAARCRILEQVAATSAVDDRRGVLDRLGVARAGRWDRNAVIPLPRMEKGPALPGGGRGDRGPEAATARSRIDDMDGTLRRQWNRPARNRTGDDVKLRTIGGSSERLGRTAGRQAVQSDRCPAGGLGGARRQARSSGGDWHATAARSQWRRGSPTRRRPCRRSRWPPRRRTPVPPRRPPCRRAHGPASPAPTTRPCRRPRRRTKGRFRMQQGVEIIGAELMWKQRE